MGKTIANLITSARILCGVWLLCVPVFSPPFYAAYLLGGFTDMVDGSVARKMDSTSRFGAALDSVADAVFAAAAFIQILPAVELPGWLWGGIVLVLGIKLGTALWSLARNRKIVLAHTVMNKLTGFLLFLLPLTLNSVDVRYSAASVCAVAFIAAVREGRTIRAGRDVL